MASLTANSMCIPLKSFSLTCSGEEDDVVPLQGLFRYAWMDVRYFELKQL